VSPAGFPEDEPLMPEIVAGTMVFRQSNSSTFEAWLMPSSREEAVGDAVLRPAPSAAF
jgi:hypothetical protein